MNLRKLFTINFLILLVIIFIALAVRLYKIDAPIADWHSWRQADTAAVTRNFIKLGFNPFYPKYDDMSGVSDPPLNNIGQYRFVEFPIYNIATYPFYLVFGIKDELSRLVSVLFSLGSLVFVYLITKRYRDTFTALVAAFIFALLPFNVFFSRTTLPEPTFIFFALGMLYFLDRWIYEGKTKWYLLGAVFGMATFLLKPWGLFFALPLIYSIIKKDGVKKLFSLKYIFVAVVILLPFIFWRLWILQSPEGIPASNWLMNGDNIRFRPAWWWWIVSQRLGGEILGVAGFALFTIGVLIKPEPKESDLNNSKYFLHFWLLSILAYFVIFATGNVRHNYYQFLAVPILSIFTAIGFASLTKGMNNFIPRLWTILIALILLPLMFYFSWKNVSGFYQVNNYPIVEAGIKANEILPKDARVIAPYNGDTAFLYQINRAGWPVMPLPVKEIVLKYGATHLVSTARDADTKYAMENFVVLEETPNYVIVDLTKLK